MADVVVSNSSWSEAFHFVPKDEHLVMFLQNRLGLPVPAGIPGITIRDVNVYGDLTPQEIFAKSEFRGPNESDKERYCFTQLKRTTLGGKRFIRTTGGGTWKLQRGENIINRTALKRAFSYKRSNSAPGSAGPDQSGWVMYEYSLLDDQGKDIALCKIIKKTPSRKRDRSSSEEDEEDMPQNGSSKRSRPLETAYPEDNGVNPSFVASNGLGMIPTLEATNESGLYGGGVEMMPSTSVIMHSYPPFNDLSFASEELRGTTMIPTNPPFVASNESGLYGGEVEMMPSTSMITHSYPCNGLSLVPAEELRDTSRSTCDDNFSILLEGLLDTSTIPTTDPSSVAPLASTISPNGDGICTGPTSDDVNEGLNGDDFSLKLLDELLDTMIDDVPSGHRRPQPAELLEMAEAGEWSKILLNGMG